MKRLAPPVARAFMSARPNHRPAASVRYDAIRRVGQYAPHLGAQIQAAITVGRVMSENTPSSAGSDALALLYVALRRHETWGYNGTQIACACDHRWRSLHDHAEHQVESLAHAGVSVSPEGLAAAERDVWFNEQRTRVIAPADGGTS